MSFGFWAQPATNAATAAVATTRFMEFLPIERRMKHNHRERERRGEGFSKVVGRRRPVSGRSAFRTGGRSPRHRQHGRLYRPARDDMAWPGQHSRPRPRNENGRRLGARSWLLGKLSQHARVAARGAPRCYNDQWPPTGSSSAILLSLRERRASTPRRAPTRSCGCSRWSTARLSIASGAKANSTSGWSRNPNLSVTGSRASRTRAGARSRRARDPSAWRNRT